MDLLVGWVVDLATPRTTKLAILRTFLRFRPLWQEQVATTRRFLECFLTDACTSLYTGDSADERYVGTQLSLQLSFPSKLCRSSLLLGPPLPPFLSLEMQQGTWLFYCFIYVAAAASGVHDTFGACLSDGSSASLAMAQSSIVGPFTTLLASHYSTAFEQEQALLAGAAAVLALRTQPEAASTAASQVIELLLSGLAPHLPPAHALLALLSRLREVLTLSGHALDPHCSDLLFQPTSPLLRLRLHNHPAVAASLMALYRSAGSLRHHSPVVVQRTYGHVATSLVTAFDQLVTAASHELDVFNAADRDQQQQFQQQQMPDATPAAAREVSIGLVFDALALTHIAGQNGAAGLFQVGRHGGSTSRSDRPLPKAYPRRLYPPPPPSSLPQRFSRCCSLRPSLSFWSAARIRS